MKKRIPVLDTNIIIRFLTGEPKSQADKIETLFRKTEKHNLYIPDMVIAEIVFVLLSFYQLSKKDVIVKVGRILDFEKFKTNRALLRTALEFFDTHNISFVDSYLLALVFHKQNDVLFTFDKRLFGVENVRTISP